MLELQPLAPFLYLCAMSERIVKEKQTIERMIRFYCQHKEGNKELCVRCTELLQYAHSRLDHCRYGVEKGACKDCPTHCYKKEMRDRIRVVMRYAGPRWVFYAPISFIRHLLNK